MHTRRLSAMHESVVGLADIQRWHAKQAGVGFDGPLQAAVQRSVQPRSFCLMFLTLPSFEQWIPPGLGPDGAKYWQGFTLVNSLPWFLLTHGAVEEGEPFAQTLILSSQSTLGKVLSEELAGRALALNLVKATKSGWEMFRVEKVWRSAISEELVPRTLSFQLAGKKGLFDAFGQPATLASESELLATFAL